MKNKIEERKISAMKNKDTNTLKVMRSILSKITEQEKINNTILTNDEIIKVIEKLSKQREESIIIFQKGNRQDLVESEQFELNILKEYLPTKKSIDETRIIVQELINNGINNIGGIMKEISKYGNLIDKKIVGDIFKELNK
jgi:uncharacterized protein YqeY